MHHLAIGCSLAVIVAVSSVSARAGTAGGDWVQWGGSNDRNMVCQTQGLPDSFEPGRKQPAGGIDPATTRHVLWTARLGSGTYGNPTVAGGRVFVGTDDLTASEDPRFKRTRGGMVKCFDEQTGKLIWQLIVPQRTKLPRPMHFGHQHLGICSSPTVDGDRVYLISCAGEVLCLDAKGQADGNDGPFQDEGRYMAGEDGEPVELCDRDGDIIWRYDPLLELGVCPHDAASCSPLVVGDFVYTSTSNGVDAAHESVLAPDAPSLIVLEKHTGRLVATDGEKIGHRLYHAQWSSPSSGEVGGQRLIFFGGGDGVCYAFEALRAVPAEPVTLSKVWSYDCNPPHYKYRDGQPIAYYDGDRRKNRGNKNDGLYVGPSQIIATPVFYGNRVYVPIGQDPAHGRGKGMLHCIDATLRGEITQSGRIWTYDGLDRSISTVAVADGLVYAPDIAGRLHCLDAQTGECCWVHETGAETWASPLVADGKIYLGTKEDFFIFAAGREPQVLAEIRLGAPVYTSAIAANGVLYVASQQYLWAVADRPAAQPPAPAPY